MNKISGIYRIVNIKNGKVYYGSSIDINARFYRHRLKLDRKNHENPYLQNAWDKYGSIAFMFEIVERCEASLLIEKEQFYMDRDDATNKDKGYNIAPRADRTKMSEETKRKIGLANAGRTTWIKGQHHSTATKQKISKSNTLHNEMRGKTGNQHHFYGKRHSSTAVDKMSKAKLGRFNNCSSKPVCQKIDGKLVRKYPSAREAGRQTGIDAKNISACLRQKRSKAGGYSWDYAR